MNKIELEQIIKEEIAKNLPGATYRIKKGKKDFISDENAYYVWIDYMNVTFGGFNITEKALHKTTDDNVRAILKYGMEGLKSMSNKLVS